MISNVSQVVIAAGLTAVLAGCGGSEFDVAKASGEVVADGQPMMMGTVMFTPVGDSGLTGKPAVGQVKPDGTFVLSTYASGDGAVVGKHRVSYSPPEGLDEEGEESAVNPDSAEGLKVAAERAKMAEAMRELSSYRLKEEMIVEVVSGEENHFTVELTPGAAEEQEPRYEEQ